MIELQICTHESMNTYGFANPRVEETHVIVETNRKQAYLYQTELISDHPCS